MIIGQEALRPCKSASFARAADGVIAAEFALLAGPFCIVLFLALELAANFMVFQQVERVGQVAAQSIRSGTLATQDFSADSFRTNVLCPKLILVSCDRLVVNLADPNVRRLTGTDSGGATWCSGGAQDVRILQLAYPVPFLSRLWAGGVADGNPYFVTTHGLRNAPGVSSGAC